MRASRAYVSAPPPLVGRDRALRELEALVATRPGAVIVAGELGVGTTRLARAAAARMALDGASLVSAEEPGPGAERLTASLAAAGHNPDPIWAARLRPLVVLLGDRPDEPGLAGELARRLVGSSALVLITSREVADDAPTLLLERLSPAEATELAAAAAPELTPSALAEVIELGEGLPGRIVPLAQAARGWPGGDEPLPIPDALLQPARERLAELEAWPLDLARWMAVLSGSATAQALARVCRQNPVRIERGLDALVQAGVMEELPPPPRVRWRFRERLVRAATAEAMGGVELRRRHAAALVASRAAGDAPADLMRHAIGSAQPDAAVAYGVRAAQEARARGAPDDALRYTERALAWWEPAIGPSAHLSAMHEQGMALLDLAMWTEAAEVLEATTVGRHQLGEHEAALASITAASSARWSLGQHDAALRALQNHLSRGHEPGTPPSAARAEALAQAAGMAVMTSRFSDAMESAGEARAEASGASADEISTRALIFLGMAESGRGGRAGLLHLSRARREGERAEGAARRNETLAMIHESHVMLALGRPEEAAACAREGAARAAELGLADHELVLAGNLGEALAAMGRLAEARERIEEAAAGWLEHARETPTPADPGLAWLVLAEGRIDEALERYRELVRIATPEAALFEQLSPVATGHALAALAAGADREAATALTGALAAWEATDDRLTSIPLLAVAAEVRDLADCDGYVAALAEMEAARAPLALPFRAYAEGQLARRRGERSPATRLRAAATAFEEMGMRWWAARARLAAGSADANAGRAGDELLAARLAFREMGATGWARRAEARLRAIGRRVPTRGAGQPPATSSLSARELEVLDQVALGLRNRDIGERLFISERTVARHLVQVYAKLGVSTRTAAVRAGRERGLLSAGA